MATQYDTQIQQLYVAYFNRPADAGGIAHWANFMANGGTAAQISAAFAQSLEYQTTYNQTTNAGVVTAIYQNLFGRSPEAAGLAFWVKALNDKAITVDNMVATISSAAQTTDKVAFDSKVKVATAFTNALDTDAEKAGYSGDLANAEAKKLLATIKTDAQANAAIVPATLDASIAAVVKASVPFTLETGLARLDASNKAVVDFLAKTEIDLNDDGVADKNVTAANIETNLNQADAKVAGLVGGNYATSAPTVKAAIVADKLATTAKDLETKQATLTTELGKLSSAQVSAVANATAATEAAKTAADAKVEADSTLVGATSILESRNNSATQTVDIADNGTVKVTVEGVPPAADKVVDVVVWKNGALALGADLKAADYPGVANYITAANAAAAAARADVDAKDAALLAQARVETLDLGSAAALTTLDGKFIVGGPVNPAADAGPTGDEIAAQLNGLKLLAVDANEKLAAAKPTDANYAALQAAAETANDNVSDFRAAITQFNTDNPTAKVKAVTDAEAAVKAAQTVHTDLEEAVADLSDAQALSTQLKALQDAVAASKKDFVDAKFAEPKDISGLSNFGTAGNDIFVAKKDVAAATITSFGLQGDDVLYVGSGYTLNKGALSTGDNAALEVFFTQQGSSTVVTIEKVAFGSSSSAGADAKVTITLTGVNADDLTFENGIISL